jgi:hypothetical protein
MKQQTLCKSIVKTKDAEKKKIVTTSKTTALLNLQG